MTCMGCGSSFVNLNETWTQEGSLSRFNWNPFSQDCKEGYLPSACPSCNRFGTIKALSWNQAAQVAPNHYQIWNKIIQKDAKYPCVKTKEHYQETAIVNKNDTSQYCKSSNIWMPQPRYQA